MQEWFVHHGMQVTHVVPLDAGTCLFGVGEHLETDNLEMLELILANIVDMASNNSSAYFLADATELDEARRAKIVKFMVVLLERYYIREFITNMDSAAKPSEPIAQEDKGEETAVKAVFSSCPTRVLDMLLHFVKLHVLKASSSPAAATLNPLFLKPATTRVFVDELLKDSLLQPPEEMALIRSSFEVFQMWILLPREEPLLLQDEPLEEIKMHVLREKMNTHARKMLDALFLIFVAPHNTTDVSSAQVALFRDVIALVRSLCMEVEMELEGKTW